MNRRTFLNVIPWSILVAGSWTGSAIASTRVGYASHVCGALENELTKQTINMGFERTSTQRQNLEEAFEIIQPASLTDLAFVVWCGERPESEIERAKVYRARRDNKILAKDYYPYVSMQDHAVPDSRGLFVFREEFPVIIQEKFELLSRRSALEIIHRVYNVFAVHYHRQGESSYRDNFQEHFDDLIPASRFEQVGQDKVYKLFVFINKEYGKALSFTYCATMAERACNV